MSVHPSICHKNAAKTCEINENQCHLVTERKATKDLYRYLIIRGADAHANSNANAPDAVDFNRMRFRCECDLLFLTGCECECEYDLNDSAFASGILGV